MNLVVGRRFSACLVGQGVACCISVFGGAVQYAGDEYLCLGFVVAERVDQAESQPGPEDGETFAWWLLVVGGVGRIVVAGGAEQVQAVGDGVFPRLAGSGVVQQGMASMVRPARVWAMTAICRPSSIRCPMPRW